MFPNLPSLNSLKMFESAARLRSFKLAAQELNVTPTAVSHQIKNLENQLQIKLFERSTRSVTLTPDGEILAQSTLKALSELFNTLEHLKTSSTNITIETTQALAAMWLAPKLAQLQRLHPKLEFKLSANDSLQPLQNNYTIDIALRYGIPPDHALAVVKEKIGCFVTPNQSDRFTKHNKLTFLCPEWKNQDLPRPNYAAALQHHLPQGKQLEIRHFNDENQLIQAALAGQGIAVVSQLLVTNAVDNNWLIPILPELPTLLTRLSYYCLVPDRHLLNQQVQGIALWLCEQLSTT